MEEKKDKGADYFANLMTGGDKEESNMRNDLLLEMFQLLTVMQFNLIEKIVTEMNKQNRGFKYSKLAKYVKDFPDLIILLFKKRMNGQLEKEKSEFKKMTGETEIGNMMGGLFGNMFNLDERFEKYKNVMDTMSEEYRTALKAGRKITDEEGEEGRHPKNDKEESKG